jgi:hypothetical protein
MITLAKVVGRMVSWLDDYMGRVYVAYLAASEPDKYTDPKKAKRADG